MANDGHTDPDNGVDSAPITKRAISTPIFLEFTMMDFLHSATTRRKVLQAIGVGSAGVSSALHSMVYAAGSDAPEKKEVKIGFIPLTDCASIVMASVLGLDQKYGVKFVLSKEASWAGVRDKLVNGELDFAHVLYGLIYGRSEEHTSELQSH